jgi:hypothetical protein
MIHFNLHSLYSSRRSNKAILKNAGLQLMEISRMKQYREQRYAVEQF